MSQVNVRESVNSDMLRFLTELAELRLQEAAVPINVTCIGRDCSTFASFARFAPSIWPSCQGAGFVQYNTELVPSSLICWRLANAAIYSDKGLLYCQRMRFLPATGKALIHEGVLAVELHYFHQFSLGIVLHSTPPKPVLSFW